jgi:hypothetical protein
MGQHVSFWVMSRGNQQNSVPMQLNRHRKKIIQPAVETFFVCSGVP